MKGDNSMEKSSTDLKFSDFIGSGHQYDHKSDDPWKAVGMESNDKEELRKKFIGAFRDTKNEKISQSIEECLKLDIPAPWKALGFMKIGEGSIKGYMLKVIDEVPEGLPVSLLKDLLKMALISGRL